MAGRYLADIESSLETVEPAFRGFAYEGCTMALAVRDGIRLYGRPPFQRHWVRDLLASQGANHIYMAYIGVGWAMARLPRLRWRAIQPHDPLLRWLALDGYGFHQAYFRTQQYVWNQHQARIPGWEPARYAGRAVDQRQQTRHRQQQHRNGIHRRQRGGRQCAEPQGREIRAPTVQRCQSGQHAPRVPWWIVRCRWAS